MNKSYATNPLPPDARLYQQYNIIAQINGVCIAIEDDRAILVDGHNLPHPVMDPQASDLILAQARLIEQLRAGLVAAYKAGSLPAAAGPAGGTRDREGETA